MSITKTLGGDRVGTGNKMKMHLHGYGRSTHDLGKVVRTTMTSGTVVPIYVEFVQKGDVWEIDLESLIKTHPLNGPLFGSYKLQLDAYMADVRLYNRKLHNNLTGVGLQMGEVKFPVMVLNGKNPEYEEGELNQQQIAPDSLLAYLGIRGLGHRTEGLGADKGRVEIRRNGIPLLMYWEIMKNYYSNKQEEKGYVISNEVIPDESEIAEVTSATLTDADGNITNLKLINAEYGQTQNVTYLNIEVGDTLIINGSALTKNNITIFTRPDGGSVTTTSKDLAYRPISHFEWTAIEDNWQGGQILYRKAVNRIRIAVTIGGNYPNVPQPSNIDVFVWNGITKNEISKIRLNEFPLTAIDDMRETIFGHSSTSALEIGYGSDTKWPYTATTGQSELSGNEPSANSNLNSFYTMSGLGIKTYQSDRFNNWLSTEWIDQINDISSVNVASGSFTMDSLNLAKKIYELSNRIAIAGNTYEDWLDAVWGMRTFGNAEMPVYIGGYSEEIVFDEVVSSSAASDGVQIDPLGTLGGTGKGIMSKGGKMRVEAKEHGFIMILASITPRIDYYQGNKWWGKMYTMDDIHKPQLDSIGFQELTIDEMAAWDTTVDSNGVETFHSIGKQPSWIHYQTNQNEVYGNFARENAEQWMTLTRRYKWNEDGLLEDGTTYVDPTQYNYPFAYVELDSQPFWCQFGIDAKVRRIMSANQIPGF